MNSYRAIQLERFAPSFREAADVITLPVRPPGAGEILVRNSWCGVNAIFDTQVARNAVDYVKIALPTIAGVEAIGLVQAVGEGVTGFDVGDAAATVRFGGGYRETHTADAARFAKTPGPEREWLALASTGVSALLALDVGEAKAGDVVAVSAAGGGLGHLIVQLAKLRGCHVVAVCGGQAKGEMIRSLGADRVIDHRCEDVAEVLAREFKDRLDVAIDTVGGGIFDAFIDNLAVHGRLVAAGAAQDLEGRPQIVTAPRIVHKLYYKGASVRGFMNGLLTDRWPAARATLFDLYRRGRIRVVFDAQAFGGLPRVYDAVERLLSGQSMGKVVVSLDPSPSAPLRLGDPMTDTATTSLRQAMPLLADNEGVWEGWYRYYDAATGKLTDEHRSRLICRLIDDGKFGYHQTNYYFWEDGRTQVRDFPAWYENGRIWWNNDLIKGWAAAMKPDDANRSTCLNWTRHGEPDLYLYEMIQNSADRTQRARTWQWFKQDKCYQRTLIDEVLITRDWRNWTDHSAPRI